jgi:hypothetical protein
MTHSRWPCFEAKARRAERLTTTKRMARGDANRESFGPGNPRNQGIIKEIDQNE